MGILIKRGDTTYLILNVYLPTKSADNLPDFIRCLYRIHTLFHNNDTVYNMAVVDFNANPLKQSIFCSESITLCHENDYVLGDQGKLPGQTFTFHSDTHDTVCWLDHALCSMSMYQIIDHMSVCNINTSFLTISLCHCTWMYHTQLFQTKHQMMYKWALFYKKLTGDNYLLKLCQTICTQLMFYSKILF